MSEKNENQSDDMYESSTARIYQSFHTVGECLCGCGQALRGPAKKFAAGHETALVTRIFADKYRDTASFVLTHSAGKAAGVHWQLTPWQPETAIGQRARGRVFAPTPLHVRGFGSTKIVDEGYVERDEEVAALYSAIITAGDRLIVELGDPFMQRIVEHALGAAGPIWLEANQALLDLKNRPTPARASKGAQGLYSAALSAIVEALDTAPDAPSPFMRPSVAALSAHDYGFHDEAEKILRDATEACVLDINSWVMLADSAIRSGRLNDALGFAEAAVAVAERSIPEHFGGVLPCGTRENDGYLQGRSWLLLLLWKFDRFDDAYRVAVDTVWLNPHDDQKIRLHLGHLKRRVPFSDAFMNDVPPI